MDQRCDNHKALDWSGEGGGWKKTFKLQLLHIAFTFVATAWECVLSWFWQHSTSFAVNCSFHFLSEHSTACLSMFLRMHQIGSFRSQQKFAVSWGQFLYWKKKKMGIFTVQPLLSTSQWWTHVSLLMTVCSKTLGSSSTHFRNWTANLKVLLHVQLFG